MALWQAVALAIIFGTLIGGLAVAPGPTAALLTALLSVPFFCVVLLRTMAAVEILRAERSVKMGTSTDLANDLPTYSILVPLFDEADVLPRLVQALAKLDYPTSRLEVLLVLEESDTKTRTAAAAMRLPPHFRTVIVPPRGPQTKPKALNYALAEAAGELVVVFDAEDRPEPDQLRRVVATFAREGSNLACIQARLNIYNHDAGFLTRQFAIEYSSLFDAILPALERFGLPVPLGGTSNHFRTRILRKVGAWDPFNVTEDADLGIRLARLGYTTRTITSTTWEEAPETFRNWLPQRTRWLKGWFQTYGVHMRHPGVLLQDLGWFRFLGFQCFMGGILLSVIVHPAIYVLLALEFSRSTSVIAMDFTIENWLWWLGGVNLFGGYASAMVIGVVSASRRRRPRLIVSVALMPLYWLLISVAGYRALLQLIRRPYHWEKTKHGVSAKNPVAQRRRAPVAPSN